MPPEIPRPLDLRFLGAAFALFALFLTGCLTRIEVQPPATYETPAGRIAVTQIGGWMAYDDGKVRFSTHNEKSYADTMAAAEKLGTIWGTVESLGEVIDWSKARHSAEIGLETAKINSANEAARIAADSELSLLQETNRATEALAAP